MQMTSGDKIEFPLVQDDRGALSFLETGQHVPFAIKRAYYLHEIPSTKVRGAHAHKALKQVMIAMNGSFDLLLDDGSQQTRYSLNSRTSGIYIGPMIWRELSNFSRDAICLVLASEHYDENDYFREYSEFIASLKS